ncbi:CHAT domain-containing protein [Lactarius sanguifluus]|nr:CHAT domain-containing protein [Lactarius sanguifluus]
MLARMFKLLMANVLRVLRFIRHKIDFFIMITLFQHLLATKSRSDPHRIRVLIGMAAMRTRRYRFSNQREDRDKSILHETEAILLPPRSWLGQDPNILETFFVLALALVNRSKVFGQYKDAIYAARYLRYLRDQPQFGSRRHEVTASLVRALAYQVDLEARNVMQCIEEMAVLCHELLTLDPSNDDTTDSLTHLAGVFLSKFSLSAPDQPLNQIIECLRLARKHRLDMAVSFALAASLLCRYFTTFVNDDYEEAASALDEIIASTSTGVSHWQDEFLLTTRCLAKTLALIRSIAHSTPEYLEEAIYRARTLSDPSSKNDIFAEITARLRFHFFGSIEGLEASSDEALNAPLFQAAPVRSSGNDDDPEINPTFEKLQFLNELLSMIRNNDMTEPEIDEAIEEGRIVLASVPMSLFTSTLFHSFGRILSEAFKRKNKIEYLNEAIDTYRQAFERTLIPALRLSSFLRLSNSLLLRIDSGSFPSHRMQDEDEVVKLLSQCVNDRHVSPPRRFQFACAWASVVRRTRLEHCSISEAYENAVSMMQDTLLFAPTLQLKHATFAKADDNSHRVPLDYASYHVDLNQLEEAIEILERGRGLLWSEMRHLRASIDQLLQADSQLGQRFAAVNRDLEELTMSIPPSHELSIDDGSADDLRAVDPFGRLILKQRGLSKERDNLISQIRTLPGFDSFLTSPSFDTLRSPASSGPVIIINHSKWRSDILILLHNASPSLILTPHDFYDRTKTLKDKLLDSRNKHGLDSSHYDETLASVLAELYDLVGEPVIDRLHQLRVPEQSRIWWCPTSVFCSLPLHAMGPIPSDGGVVRYFLDLYICSYTPTLSALIQSRIRDSDSLSMDRPSLLLVAQPDPSLPTVGGEIQVVRRLDTDVTSLISEAATPAAVIDGFHHHQFIHFACHGTLEADKPFEAGFELYGDKRLTLLDIVRSDLPTAEFAFLSACHTAEVTEGSIIDEGLHLAAAVQYCGFRSVVGTMWAMVDEDGQDLAEHFYKALFSNSRREQGVPYHERSAKALRFAVKKLRKKRRISLERWVNFVHYGA